MIEVIGFVGAAAVLILGAASTGRTDRQIRRAQDDENRLVRDLIAAGRKPGCFVLVRDGDDPILPTCPCCHHTNGWRADWSTGHYYKVTCEGCEYSPGDGAAFIKMAQGYVDPLGLDFHLRMMDRRVARIDRRLARQDRDYRHADGAVDG